MSVDVASIVDRHPCYARSRDCRYSRIHLAVAPECNLGCNYCERQIGGMTYHSYRPAVADRVLTPREAMCEVAKYANDEDLTVAGIAGPGEPLCNPGTFETLKLVHRSYPRLMLCLSTNGLLLPRYAEWLHGVGVRAVTVTVNTVDPAVGENIYAYVKHNGDLLAGRMAARLLLERQLVGVEEAARSGLVVKVNSILIPGINDGGHLEDVAGTVKALGAYIQNITRLIPLGRFSHLRAPSCEELSEARLRCERIIRQFRYCEQCRADSVGRLGVSRRASIEAGGEARVCQ